MFEKIRNAQSVWIYGIGRIGKRICQIFEYCNISVEGIVVSSKSQNISSYRGVEVYELDAISDKNALIVIAADGKVQIEIQDYLEQNGYFNYMVWTDELLCEIWKTSEYIFENRQQGKEKVCLVLSGYKDFLWPIVYQRLAKFVPADTEVCICSAGLYSEELSDLAAQYGWSYLSTSVNSVSLIQNITISLYDSAQWIYKMDEDVFITENAFDYIYELYNQCEKDMPYKIGYVAPLILVNGFCYRYILEKYGKLEDFESRFGKAYIGGNSDLEIVKNPDAAKYMWGEGGMPVLDTMAKELASGTGHLLANVRFSIGFMLFKREMWNAMMGYEVLGNKDLGVDEEDVGRFCMNESRAIVVAKNALVGHFSFGKQTAAMRKYFDEHHEQFEINSCHYTSVALCGYREKGRILYEKLCSEGVSIPYIIERNYQSLSYWESDLESKIVGFQESKEFYNQADAVLLTGDLPDAVIREALELAGINLPIITEIEV